MRTVGRQCQNRILLTPFNYVKDYGMSGRISLFSISNNTKPRCSRLKLQRQNQIRLLAWVLSWKGSKALDLPARKSGEHFSAQVFENSLVMPQVGR